ncbi:MAG TPA: hypothetical protein VMU34_01110 [Mycobacterium sp.]|nr:hypothetical protein [Mycobacterium sp.]
MTTAGQGCRVMLTRLSESTDAREITIDMEEASPANLLDQMADLDPQAQREVAAIVRRLCQNLAEVPDGKATSYVLGVLACLLDPR